MPEQDPDILSCKEVKVYFGALRAVDGVSLTLHPGEVLGLIGPNGAGKTTLLNALSGFLKMTSGKVTLGNVITNAWSPEKLVRAGVARTFQSVAVFASLSVYENVEAAALGASARRREARRRTGEILDVLGLTRIADHLSGAISQGDQRRVGIARAVALRPRFLLLDEPAAGLNDYESTDLAQAISEVQSSMGCGILLVEHDMEVIMGTSHRIHVLDSGRSLAEGSPADIRANPAVIEAYLGKAAAEHARS